MRRILFPVLLLATAALVYFGVSLWNADPGGRVVEIGSPEVPDESSVAPQPASTTVVGAEASPAGISKEAVSEGSLGLSPEDLAPVAGGAEAFLERRGASAFNLLAVFTATGEERFLEQALAKFPNDPAVLYVALTDAPKGPNRSSLIERFKAADPNNPLPWVFSAAELFEDGRAADAVAELWEAIKRPGFYTYFNERAAALRELALSSGLGEFAAESMALFTQRLPHLSAAMKASQGLQAYVDAQIADGDNNSIRANVNLLYDMGRMFQTPEAARLLVGQLVGVALERKALEVAGSLPENPLPIAPGPRAEELAEMREEATALSKGAARIHAEPALWKEYFARFRSDGEIAALRWVQQQPEKPAASATPLAVPAASGLKLK